MKKTNYLIPTLSLLFLGVAAFFIVKGINTKKNKKEGSKQNANDGGGEQGGSGANTSTQSSNDTGLATENITEKKIAAKVLTSKAGTRLREKPSTSSTIVKSLAKGLKLKRVPNSPINFLANLPVKDGENYWVYVQLDNSLTKGFVRTDAVDI